MFDDDKPVKDFGFAGRSKTRGVLDKLGGQGEFRTGYALTPNGWVMLKTHGGLPRTYPTQLSTRPIEEEEIIPDYHIFQVTTRADMDWPATPIATTATMNYWASKDPRIDLEEVSTTAKGDCEWFGASPRVVTWFGLNSSGRQASSLFYWRMTTLSRHKPLAHSSRRQIQREAVWVDGEKWFDLPLNRAPLCAAMAGDLLRVIAIDQTAFATTAAFAKDGTGGTNLAEISGSVLYLYEGTKDAMTMMRTVTFDLGSGTGYIFLQSLFFSPDGEKAAGIIGITGYGSSLDQRIVEVSFSDGGIPVFKKSCRYSESGWIDEYENWRYTFPTGLPVDDGNYVRQFGKHGTSPGGFRPSYGVTKTKVAVAVEYRHSDGKLCVLNRKYVTATGPEYIQMSDFEGLITPDEFEYLATGEIYDNNLEAHTEACIAAGITPTTAGLIEAPNRPLPGNDLTGRYGAGAYPGSTSTPPGVYVSFERQDYVWIIKRRREHFVYDWRIAKDIHYELEDIDGNSLSEKYSSRTSNVYSLRLEEQTVEYGHEIITEPQDLAAIGPNGTFPYTVTNVFIRSGEDSFSSTSTTIIDKEETEDGHDIIAADLRKGIYVLKTPSGRQVVSGFPTHNSGNVIAAKLPPGFPEGEEEDMLLQITDLEKPYFGIEHMTLYKSGNHLVFSMQDVWSGGTSLAHWSPSAGISSISTGAPHEAPIYFRSA